MKTKITLIIGTAVAVIGTSSYAMYSDKLDVYFETKQIVSDMNALNESNNSLRIDRDNLLSKAERIEGEANIIQIKIDANKKTWTEKNGQLKLLKGLGK